MNLRIALALLSVTLAGCANFRAVSEFAQQTSKVTGVVRAEFVQLDVLCKEQAELSIVINDIKDEQPLKTCQAYRATQGRLAVVTLDVLDGYAQALGALADKRNFDLSADIDTLGGQVQSLRDGAGNPVVSPAEVTALTKIVEVLADIVTEARREAAVKRLVQEKPDLVVTGRILRSFFVVDPSAPPGRAKAPYTNLVGLAVDDLNSSERILRSKPFQAAEPIRTVELLRGMRSRKAQLEMRSGSSAEKVPVAIVAAIDAWLHALDEFSDRALKPDPKEFIDRIKDVRSKANAARDALRAAND